MTTTEYPTKDAQLPLIDMTGGVSSVKPRRNNRKVERTLAQIRQLHDELNSELYSSPSERPALHSPKDVAELLNFFIGSLDHEEMWVVCLDQRNRVRCLVELYKGSVNSSQVRVAEVFRQAIAENSPAIIVAHNHPSGDTTPSPVIWRKSQGYWHFH